MMSNFTVALGITLAEVTALAMAGLLLHERIGVWLGSRGGRARGGAAGSDNNVKEMAEELVDARDALQKKIANMEKKEPENNRKRLLLEHAINLVSHFSQQVVDQQQVDDEGYRLAMKMLHHIEENLDEAAVIGHGRPKTEKQRRLESKAAAEMIKRRLKESTLSDMPMSDDM